MQTRLILGGPGSGKTSRLLEVMWHELSHGIPPGKIALVSFTKKATEEARIRAMKKFNLEADDLPYIRTLHSLCYWKLSIRPGMVMTMKDYHKIADRLGVELSRHMFNPDDTSGTIKDGDKMIHYHNLMRTTKTNLREVWEAHDSPFLLGRLEQWVATCEQFKQDFNKVDFTDMLTRFVTDGFPLPVEVAFIDEAQDLTELEWDVIELAFGKVKRRYIAGDDDQAIYGWSGANVERFLTISHDEMEVLPISYRLPHKIFTFATAFAKRFIKNRYEKDWNPHPDNDKGFIKRISSLSELNLNEGSWYLLGRNSCFLPELTEFARQSGVTYTYKREPSIDETDLEVIRLYVRWKKGEALSMVEIKKIFGKMNLTVRVPHGNFTIDKFSKNPPRWDVALKGIQHTTRAYYTTILRKGNKLSDIPQVHINTIHGVKGGEADNIVIMTDMTRRTYEGMLQKGGFDYEGRVFYVSVTRAKKGVYILLPRTQNYFSGFNEI